MLNIPEMKSKELNQTGVSFNNASSNTPPNEGLELAYPSVPNENGTSGKRQTVTKNASTWVNRNSGKHVKVVDRSKNDVSTGIVQAAPAPEASKGIANFGNASVPKDDDRVTLVLISKESKGK